MCTKKLGPVAYIKTSNQFLNKEINNFIVKFLFLFQHSYQQTFYLPSIEQIKS